jgi:hypothetical protein
VPWRNIEDRWEKSVDGQGVRTGRFGQGNRWRARYLSPDGRERSRTFARKVDATRFLTTVESDKMRGSYVDPDAGKITLDAYFADFSDRQLWETGTRSAMNLAVRCAGFGATPLARLRRSHIETWVKRMSADGLAPGTIKTRVNNVRSVLHAAVRDQVIAVDPSDNIVLPRDRRREAAMVLPTAERVGAVIAAATPWFEAFVALAAFAGLRLGEAAGTQVGDINFLARSLDGRRQCSAVVPVRSRCERRSTAASERCSWRTVCSTCSPNTLRPTGPVRIPDDGCSRRVPASHHTRTPPAINGAGHAAARTSAA